MENAKLHKETYDIIMDFYDLAEGMLDAIEDERVVNAEDQLEVTEPVIHQVQASTEVIADAYIEFCKNNEERDPRIQRAIASEIRKICASLLEFKETAEVKLKPKVE